MKTQNYYETFECLSCNWHGDKPSFSDASELRYDSASGVYKTDYCHRPICPVCFSPAAKTKYDFPTRIP